MEPIFYLMQDGCNPTVEARKLECDRPLIPTTKERRKTNTNHPKSKFQLFGVYCVCVYIYICVYMCLYIYISLSLSLSPLQGSLRAGPEPGKPAMARPSASSSSPWPRTPSWRPEAEEGPRCPPDITIINKQITEYYCVSGYYPYYAVISVIILTIYKLGGVL